MIAENIAFIRARMEEAARKAGRDPKEILLCAATKMNDADRVREAIAAGVDCCGENRVQELTEKLADHAYDGKPVHFIGHLQTNKVRQVVGKVDLIQSVDRPELLACIEKEAAKQDIVQDILLEINIGGEESKSGFSPDQVPSIAASMESYPHCRLRGLMAIPPISKNPGDNCRFFTEIQRISVDIRTKKYNNSSMEILSMGMTDDFEDAIACGSTMIRVGTAIFGARNYTK
ncbi:MAG: YggS family pyridoxal phosphate-dependent enzyme [Faecousia sp.]